MTTASARLPNWNSAGILASAAGGAACIGAVFTAYELGRQEQQAKEEKYKALVTGIGIGVGITVAGVALWMAAPLIGPKVLLGKKIAVSVGVPVVAGLAAAKDK